MGCPLHDRWSWTVSKHAGTVHPAAAKLLDFAMLTYLRALFLHQLFRSTRVDQSAHPISRSDQLYPRPPAPIYGLGIVADHARKVDFIYLPCVSPSRFLPAGGFSALPPRSYCPRRVGPGNTPDGRRRHQRRWDNTADWSRSNPECPHDTQIPRVPQSDCP